jgi:hypothetical protein
VVTTAAQAQAVDRPRDAARGFSTKREGEVMEIDRFDALTRALSTTDSRRRTLRALGATLLSGVAATLGLGEGTEAKKHGKRHKDSKQSGHVQAAGKHHKKHKHKDKHKDKHKPEKPRQCSPGFRLCSNGSCMADKPGICCSDEEFCPGGRCRPKNGCCPDDKPCDDGSCVSQDVCCPGNRPCPDGGCALPGNCCGGEKQCIKGGQCYSKDTCCPNKPACDECEEAVCENGEWTCRTTTCEGDKVCCLGVCIPPCANGCEIDDGCGHCTEPPVGKVYCPGKDQCVTRCGFAKRLDPVTCQCVPVGPICRPNHSDCKWTEMCCQGHCIDCAFGGVCSEDGFCRGCGGNAPISCPPNPMYPNGHCCLTQDSNGNAFSTCHLDGEPDYRGWGCYYNRSS